uniref:Uncharacterized protein n=1 Tax=viral metagenome TaxID=1070528 RepID=A0A6H1ZI54_9ZZZZ
MPSTDEQSDEENGAQAEMPDRAFLNREERTYPVMRESEGEWRWDCDLIKAAIRRARTNDDAPILSKAEDLWERVCSRFEDDESEGGEEGEE